MTTTIRANSGTYRIGANLARASFRRSGSHLRIVLEDENEILLEDYYLHDTPQIVDPGGNAYDPQATAAYTPLSEASILDETHAREFEVLESLGGLIHLDGLDRSPSWPLSTMEMDFFSASSPAPAAQAASFGAYQAQAPALPDIRITVSEADGQAMLDIPEGWAVIEGGSGAYGHIGQLDGGAWAFVLDRPYGHDPVQGRNLALDADSVRILMADPAGGVRYVEIPVSIVDDVPSQGEAESLIQLPEILPQGDFYPLSIAGKEARGNIRTDLAGDIAFEPGADGARFVWGEGEPDSQGNFVPLVGTYGTLIGNADGSYVYVNNENSARGLIPGEIGKDSFTVRYQDADGDQVTHTLTVARTGQDDPITIISRDEALTVWESALPEGTDPDPARLAASGSLKFSAPDGITKITITTTSAGTHELDLNGGECRIGTDAWTAVFRRGALGEISYDFRLTGPVHHDENSDVFYQDFNLSFRDRSGTELKGVKIPLAIMNDGPLAPEPLSYEISDSGISGSLMDHIQAGADGAGGFFNWEKRPDLAAYGTWTTDRQGNFSFEPDHSLPAFLDLKPGESIEIPLGYRFTDADNDWVEGKIILTIMGIEHPVSITPQGSEIPEDGDPLGPNAGVNAAGDAFARVYESGLDGQLAPRKASGTIAVDAPGGLDSLTISYGGKDYDLLAGNAAINLDCGQLTAKLANGRISYTFQLKSGAAHPEPGNDSVFRELGIHAVNASGNQADSRLVLQIVDDTPRAWGLGSDADGNAWLDFSFGADRGAGAHLEITAPDGTIHAVDSWNPTEIAGAHGTLSIDLNGDYRYEGEGGKDVFRVAIVDADGDRVADDLDGNALKLEFGEEPEAPKEPIVLQARVQAYEELIGEPVEIRLPEEIAVTGGLGGRIGHVEIINGKPAFILDLPVQHWNFPVAAGADLLRLEARDGSGQPYVIELSVDVNDGYPTVRVPESATMWGDETYRGQLPDSWHEFGADAGDGKKIEFIFDGKTYEYVPGQENVFFGGREGIDRTLTIHEDGSFEIGHGRSMSTIGYPIWIRVTDSDGSVAIQNFHVDQAISPIDTHRWINEIIGEEREMTTFAMQFVDSIEIVQQGQYGTARLVEWGENGLQLLYRLERAVHKGDFEFSGAMNLDADSVVVRLTTSGKDYYCTCVMDVRESWPDFRSYLDDGSEMPMAGVDVVPGETVTGSWRPDYGADDGDGARLLCNGKRIEPNAESVIEGKYGTLHLHADGTFEYQPDGSGSGADSFSFTIWDSDGDTGSGMMTFNVPEKPAEPLEPLSLAISAHESAMGQALALEIPDGFTLAERVDGQYGHVETLDGKAVYVLDRPVQHARANGLEHDAETIGFTLTDGRGAILEASLAVDVQDGGPSVKAPESGKMWANGVYHGQLPDSWLDFGADDGDGKKVIFSFGGESHEYVFGQTNVFVNEGKSDSRTLTINPDGSFTLHNEDFKQNSQQTMKGEIGIAVRDSDGSVATDTFYVSQAAVPSLSGYYNDKVDFEKLACSHWMHETIGETMFLGSASIGYMDAFEVVQNGVYGSASFVVNENGFLRLEYTLEKAVDKREFEQDERHGTNLDVDTIIVKYSVGGSDIYHTYNVDVRDDVPSIWFTHLDGSSIDFASALKLASGSSVEGLWRASYGADDWGGQYIICNGQRFDPESDAAIECKFGTIDMRADGTFTYRSNGTAGSESVLFYIYDADGDRSSSGMVFSIIDHALPISLAVSERSGSGEIPIPDGYTLESLDSSAGLGHVERQDGKLIYVLDGPVDSGAIEGANTLADADSVSLTLKDPDGNRVKGIVKVSITDDIPEIASPGADVLSGSTVSGQLGIAYGADGPGGLAVNGAAIDGQAQIAGTFGTLTIDPDGVWSYRANPLAAGEAGGQDRFAVRIADGDGDLASSELVLTVAKPEAPEIEDHAQGDERSMGEAAPFTVIPEGYRIVPGEYRGECARIVSNAGKNGLIIDKPFAHDRGEDARAGADTVMIRVADAAGNEWDIPVMVDIADDAPTVFSMKDYESIRTGETLSGQLEFSWGADDGPGRLMEAKINGGEYIAIGEKGATLGGFNGTAFVSADGAWRYAATLDPDSRAKDEIFFRITDADGDQVESWLGFEIKGPIIKWPGGTVIRESQLYSEDPSCRLLLTEGWEPEAREYQGQYGTLAYTGIDPKFGVPALAYTLRGPFQIGEDGMGETWNEMFTVTLTDGEGHWETESLEFTVMDDCVQIRALESAGGRAAIALPEGWTLSDVRTQPMHGAIEGTTYIPDEPAFDGLLARADLFAIEMSDGGSTGTVKVGVDFINDTLGEILSEQAGGEIALDMDGWRVTEVLEDGSYGHAEQEEKGWIYRFGGEVSGEAGETVYDTIGLRYQNGQTGETIDLDMRVGIINDVEDDLAAMLAPQPAMMRTFYCMPGQAISGQLPEYPGDPEQGIEIVAGGSQSRLTIDEGPIDTGSGELGLDPDGTWRFISSGPGTITLRLPDGTACQIISIDDEGAYNELVYGHEPGPGGDVLVGGDAWADPGDLEMLAYRQTIEAVGGP